MPRVENRHRHASNRRSRRPDLLAQSMAWIGMIGAACFFASMTVLNLLRPDISLLDDYVSDLANGPLGGAMTISFFLHGASCAALGIGLARSIVSTPSHRTATVLLILGGLGVFGLGLFPTDPVGAPRTTAGTTHLGIAFIAFAALTTSFMIFTHAFHHDRVWDQYHVASRVLAITAATAFGLFATLVVLARVAGVVGAGHVLGAAERLTILTNLVWVFFTALRLRSVSAPWGGQKRAARAVPVTE